MPESFSVLRVTLTMDVSSVPVPLLQLLRLRIFGGREKNIWVGLPTHPSAKARTLDLLFTFSRSVCQPLRHLRRRHGNFSEKGCHLSRNYTSWMSREGNWESKCESGCRTGFRGVRRKGSSCKSLLWWWATKKWSCKKDRHSHGDFFKRGIVCSVFSFH